MNEVEVDMYYNKLEKEYFLKHNPYLIEEKILYSISEKELKEYIEYYEDAFLKLNLPYLHNINKEISKYYNINELEKYFIEQIQYYFNGGENIEMMNDALCRFLNFYKLNYMKNRYNNEFKRIDIKTIPIEGIIGKYIKLPANLNKNFNCPFHKEKTGSFRLYSKTNSFYCFGCHKGGNIINFIAYIKNITTKEAFKELINLHN